MTTWKMPPKAKVYEALSAVADGRVEITGPGTARVVSSSGERTYTVTWSANLREVNSNDNASFWQGYLGYPIIAVLLALGTIPYDPKVAGWLAGVPWKELNIAYKRDFDTAVDHVLRTVAARGHDRSRVTEEAECIFAELAKLDLQKPEKRKKTKD